jgi:thiol-disulfide isomerase/thioredoxin
MKWKKILKELAAGVVIAFIFLNIISWIKKPDLDSTQLPSGTVTLLDGSRYTFKKGKPVVLHFWATWCRVCQMEVSNIESLSREYDVLTIAVNSGDDRAMRAYMRTHGLHFKVLNDTDGNWTKRFKVEAFPTTFVYDSRGELRFTEVGYTTTAGLFARMKLVE